MAFSFVPFLSQCFGSGFSLFTRFFSSLFLTAFALDSLLVNTGPAAQQRIADSSTDQAVENPVEGHYDREIHYDKEEYHRHDDHHDLGRPLLAVRRSHQLLEEGRAGGQQG